MKTNMKTLSAEADAMRAGRGVTARPEYVIRADMEAALAAEYPAAARAAADAAARGAGKKAVVAAAAAAIIDLDDPRIVEALADVASARSWRAADRALARLGFAGELIASPQARGLRLPCAAHACPSSWGTNWGLPNVQAVAERLVERAPAQPTSGNGWALLPA
jgi:hypothetical protein